MKLGQYLDLYRESHQHPVNIQLHNICIPLIAWSSLGFAHSFDVAGFHLSYLSAGITLICYSIFKNLKVLLLTALAMAVFFWTYQLVPHLRLVVSIVFILGWIGQLYGHHLEKKKPSFSEDIIFFLIGPVWMFKKLNLIK